MNIITCKRGFPRISGCRAFTIGLVASLITAAFASWLHWSLQYPANRLCYWSADDEYSEDNGTHRARLALGAELVQGKFDRAVKLDGTNATVVLGDSAPPGKWTLALWVRPDRVHTGVRLIAGSPHPNLPFGLVSSNEYFGVMLPLTNKGVSILNSGVLTTPGRWFHIAAASDGQTIKMYVDGKPRAAAPAAEYSPNRDEFGIYLGNWFGPPRDSGFAGLLDEISIYDRCLSGPDIRALYRSMHLNPAVRWHVGVLLGSFSMALILATVTLSLIVRLSPRLSEGPATLSWTWFWPVAAVMVTGVTGSGYLFKLLHREQEQRDRHSFRKHVDDFLDRFDTRTERYMQGLSSLQAMFSSTGEITQEKWEEMTGAIQYPADFPGVVSLGFAPLIRPENLAGFEEWAKRAVVTNFQIHPIIAETDRIPLCEIFEDCPRARLPVTFHSSSHNVPMNRKATDWGGDLLGIRRDRLNANQPVLGTFRNALNSGAAWASVPGVIDTAFRQQEGRIGTYLFSGVDKPLGVTNWQTFKSKTKSSHLRYPGALFACFDWQEFFYSALQGQKLEIGFRMSGPTYDERIPLARSDTIDRSSTPYDPGLHAQYRTPFYYRALYFDFYTTPHFYAGPYRYLPAVFSGGVAAATLGMAALLIIQLRARWKEALSAHQLRQSRDELQILLHERERLSRDLHDGTIQSIYAIGLGLKRCEKIVEQNPVLARGQLAASITEVNSTIADLRQFVLSLEPDLPAGESLGSALISLGTRLQRATGTEISVQLEPVLADAFAPRCAIYLLNIAREAISNSVRHGRATQIRIQLSRSGQICRLAISDNGAGFDPGAPSGGGKGLLNFKARAQELNGVCHINSRPGSGTSVIIELPA